MSWASATSPISSTTGPAAAAAAPNARGDRAVDAVGAAVAQHARRVSRAPARSLDVADRHRGGDEQRRLARQQDAELGRDGRARTARRRRARRRSPRPPARRRLRQPRQPASLGPPPAAHRRAADPSSAPRGLERERLASEHRGRVLPGALGVERHLAAPRAAASQLRSGLETGRSPTRSDQIRRRAGSERRDRAAARRSGRSAAAPRRAPDSGSASSGQPAAAANAAAACAERCGCARGGRPRARRARRRDELRQPCGRRHGPVAPARRGERRDVRAAVRAGRCRPRAARPSIDERLAQREVQVDDAGPALERRPVGAAGERAHPAQPLAARRRGCRPRRTTSPRRRTACIWSIACPAPFSRSSGGRSAVSSSSGTRASRASIAAGSSSAAAVPEVHVDGDRQSRGLRQAEREEARAALVDVRVAAQALLARERQHQRRASASPARCRPRASRSAPARPRRPAAAV